MKLITQHLEWSLMMLMPFTVTEIEHMVRDLEYRLETNKMTLENAREHVQRVYDNYRISLTWYNKLMDKFTP